jgi:hypothetical protein
MFTGDQRAVRINMNEVRTHQREFQRPETQGPRSYRPNDAKI